MKKGTLVALIGTVAITTGSIALVTQKPKVVSTILYPLEKGSAIDDFLKFSFRIDDQGDVTNPEFLDSYGDLSTIRRRLEIQEEKGLDALLKTLNDEDKRENAKWHVISASQYAIKGDFRHAEWDIGDANNYLEHLSEQHVHSEVARAIFTRALTRELDFNGSLWKEAQLSIYGWGGYKGSFEEYASSFPWKLGSFIDAYEKIYLLGLLDRREADFYKKQLYEAFSGIKKAIPSDSEIKAIAIKSGRSLRFADFSDQYFESYGIKPLEPSPVKTQSSYQPPHHFKGNDRHNEKLPIMARPIVAAMESGRRIYRA